MGFASHLGPWLLGTVKYTTGTTVGTIAEHGRKPTVCPICHHEPSSDTADACRIPCVMRCRVANSDCTADMDRPLTLAPQATP
jgi:hypothetical protein